MAAFPKTPKLKELAQRAMAELPEHTLNLPLKSLAQILAPHSRRARLHAQAAPERLTTASVLAAAIDKKSAPYFVDADHLHVLVPEIHRLTNRGETQNKNERCPTRLRPLRDALLKAQEGLNQDESVLDSSARVHTYVEDDHFFYVEYARHKNALRVRVPLDLGEALALLPQIITGIDEKENDALAYRALDAALALICEPGAQEEALCRSLVQAPWERLLHDVSEALPEALSLEKKTLTKWSLSVERGGVFFTPFETRPRKSGGGFTKAVAKTLTHVIQKASDESDRALALALQIYTQSGRGLYAVLCAASAVGHVVDSQTDAALSVHEGGFVLDVDEVEVDGDKSPADEGFSLGIALQSRGEIYGNESAQMRWHDDAAVVFDAAKEALVFARPSPAVERLAEILTLAPESARIPKSESAALMNVIARTEGVCEVRLPTRLDGERRTPSCVPVVRLKQKANFGVDVEIGVRPLTLLNSPFCQAGVGDVVVKAHNAKGRFVCERDFDLEKENVNALLNLLPLEPEDVVVRGLYRLTSQERVLDLVQVLDEQGANVQVEWSGEKTSVVAVAKTQDLRLNIKKHGGWFAAQGEVRVRVGKARAEVDLGDVMRAIFDGRRYVEVKRGEYLKLSHDMVKVLNGLADAAHGVPKKGALSFGPQAALSVRDLAEEGAALLAHDQFHKTMSRLSSAEAVQAPVPNTLTATLRPYQEEGLVWGARLSAWGMGGILADDMGLGKTLQAIAIMLHRTPSNDAGPSTDTDALSKEGPHLVVAPTSVTGNWKREIERFAPSLIPVLYEGGAKRRELLKELSPRHVLIASYGVMLRDVELLQHYSDEILFNTLVLDEAQAIKNAQTLRSKALRTLHADFILALSGTPVENDASELWSIFRVVNPGLFGTFQSFKKRFGHAHRSTLVQKRLANVVRPFLLRRTKENVAPELPERIETTMKIKLSDEERTLYEQARGVMLASFESKNKQRNDGRIEVLAALTKLRLLACHPKLFDPKSDLSSSKLKALLRLVHDLRENGHRALIFSQFVSHLSLVREALEEKEVPYLYFDGSVSPKQRRERIDAFQRGTGDVFLISLKAGGTGVHLTAADYVIHLDPWWNPAVEDQATDRAHRIGQHRPVHVYRLVSEGTVEEKILQLHKDKRALVDGLLAGSDQKSALSVDDLLRLMNAPRDRFMETS